jgi:hypothetical protein
MKLEGLPDKALDVLDLRAPDITLSSRGTFRRLRYFEGY